MRGGSPQGPLAVLAARAAIAAIAAASCLAGVLACGGSGGGPGPGPVAPPGITYSPAGAATQNAMLLVAGESTTDRLTLRLEARGVAGLAGVAVDLTYPVQVLSFDGFSGDSSILAADGTAVSVQVTENPSGRLVIAAARLGSAPGLTSATGLLLSLRFVSSASGSGAFAFQGPVAFDQRGGSLGGLQWLGGSVAVVR